MLVNGGGGGLILWFMATIAAFWRGLAFVWTAREEERRGTMFKWMLKGIDLPCSCLMWSVFDGVTKEIRKYGEGWVGGWVGGRRKGSFALHENLFQTLIFLVSG